MSRLVRPLDRYVFAEFWKIFVVTALGFPLLVIIIDLTDQLEKYLNRNLPKRDIALSYLYWMPENMFMVLPAAVLFATVFSIGALTRHAEITAAKASGISFYRMIAPIVFGAFLAAGLDMGLGELAPRMSGKRAELLQEQRKMGSDRFNFAHAAEHGRVYKVQAMSVERRTIDGLTIERKGNGPEYPTVVITAQNAAWDTTRARWKINQGTMHVIPDTSSHIAFQFDSAVDRRFVEKPRDLMALPKAPSDMGYRELGAYINAMERSGSDVGELRVERMLKLAIPVTCIVILLFGAPLATSTQRGGAAFGAGISLGTTVIFLMLIQLTKAIGKGGILMPEIAAWLPSIVFAVIGAILMARVRT